MDMFKDATPPIVSQRSNQYTYCKNCKKNDQL